MSPTPTIEVQMDPPVTLEIVPTVVGLTRVQDALDLSGVAATGKGLVRAADGTLAWTDVATQAELDAATAAVSATIAALHPVHLGAIVGVNTDAPSLIDNGGAGIHVQGTPSPEIRVEATGNNTSAGLQLQAQDSAGVQHRMRIRNTPTQAIIGILDAFPLVFQTLNREVWKIQSADNSAFPGGRTRTDSDYANVAGRPWAFERRHWKSTGVSTGALNIWQLHGIGRGTRSVNLRMEAFNIQMDDDTTVAQLLVTGASGPGASPIVLTLAASHPWQTGFVVAVDQLVGNTEAIGAWIVEAVAANQIGLYGPIRAITAATGVGGTIVLTSNGHLINNGDTVIVADVVGMTAANGKWVVQNRTANTFELAGSVGDAAYEWGGVVGKATLGAGSWVNGGFATNRPMLYGMRIGVHPVVDRGQAGQYGLTGALAFSDDLNGLVVANGGTGKATAAVLVGSGGSGWSAGMPEWNAGFDVEARCRDAGFIVSSEITGTAGAAFRCDTCVIPATGFTFLQPNDRAIGALDNGGVPRAMLKLNISTQVEFLQDVTAGLNLFAADRIRYTERASGDPQVPNADQVVVYAKDNGSGKTLLCARFATGAIQTLATQP